MEKAVSKRGRPRCFGKDEKLEAAVEVFLEHGYENASLDDITEALGINKPSLYNTFGNKEEFFLSVLDRYHEYYQTYFAELVGKDQPPKETVTEWLSWFLQNYKSQENKHGCLIVNSTLLANEKYPAIASRLKSFHDLNERLLTNYLKKEKKAGRFEGDPKSTSQFYNAIVQGMAVLHRTQGNQTALRNIAERALESWPD